MVILLAPIRDGTRHSSIISKNGITCTRPFYTYFGDGRTTLCSINIQGSLETAGFLRYNNLIQTFFVNVFPELSFHHTINLGKPHQLICTPLLTKHKRQRNTRHQRNDIPNLGLCWAIANSFSAWDSGLEQDLSFPGCVCQIWGCNTSDGDGG